MQTVRIRQLEAHYHLRTQGADQRARIDGILRQVVQDTLEHALDRVGFSPLDLVCIRRLHVPVHLRLSQPDRDLAACWSLELASAIQRASERDEPEWMVRYRSIVEALADLAFRVGSGDVRRSWAWAQLDLTPRDLSAADRSAAIVAALLRHPETIVPVLRVLAGRDRLEVLARRLDARAWNNLARAALRALGTDADFLLNTDAGTTVTAEIGRHSTDVLPASFSQSSLARVLNAPHVQRSIPGESWTAVAALVCWDVDPARLRSGGEHARSFVQAARRRLREPGLSQPGSSDPEPADAGKPEHKARPMLPSSQSATPRRITSSSRQGIEPRTETLIELTGDNPDAEGRNVANVAEDSIASPRLELVRGALGEREVFPRVHGAAPPIDLPLDEVLLSEPAPRRVPTQFGGLLFLVHVVQEIELPRRAGDGTCGRQRTLRWVLQQLAMMLLPVTPDDPAALAFAGLTVDDPPPARDEPPTAAELEELTGWADAVREALRQRLPESGASGPVLLDRVCRRSATVLGHPGWIVVYYSLRDVSTEIRRAGLDLDPGFVPWLGAVIKFLYE